MEFAHRSATASAAGVVDNGRRIPDTPFPPPMHGDSMQTIRDALLSQLQKDRLRQEIVVAELSKIECAMALRSAAADAERAKQAAFDFDEQFMTHGTGKANDQKKEDGVRRRSRQGKRSKGRPVTEDGLTPSTKWSCDICRVEATSAGNLLQHFSGQKHQANANALKAKAKAKAEKSQKATQCAEKLCPPWTCKFCQSNCTCKSDLENHLNGRRHRANIEALLEECKSMARDSVRSREADSRTSITSHDEEKSASESICGICQVKWSCQSVMEGHVGGKKHQKNFQALQLEANRLRIIQPKTARKEQATPEWDCSTCQKQFGVQQRKDARSPSSWEKASGKTSV
ncbi:hypothetical protein EJB05_50464 [Eragrostis curvula]|uniref:C2H2-type domain-containing protein n=1 Tax=Eragrostis curvula TaxID=38414 RepID=A0A5J9SY95_9POAL|nr:hypothetical protein EJB05_50464 [Eragrostis curvula]